MTPGELTAQALLCDFAEVSGGKLFVSGAGINLLATGQANAPHPVNFALALLVRIPWTATNQQHTLIVELISDSPDGGPRTVPINEADPPAGHEDKRGKIVALFNAGRSPNMLAGEESLMPVAMPLAGLALPDIGSYYFSVMIDGTEVDRVSFRLVSVLSMSGFPQPMQR